MWGCLLRLSSYPSCASSCDSSFARCLPSQVHEGRAVNCLFSCTLSPQQRQQHHHSPPWVVVVDVVAVVDVVVVVVEVVDVEEVRSMKEEEEKTRLPLWRFHPPYSSLSLSLSSDLYRSRCLSPSLSSRTLPLSSLHSPRGTCMRFASKHVKIRYEKGNSPSTRGSSLSRFFSVCNPRDPVIPSRSKDSKRGG